MDGTGVAGSPLRRGLRRRRPPSPPRPCLPSRPGLRFFPPSPGAGSWKASASSLPSAHWAEGIDRPDPLLVWDPARPPKASPGDERPPLLQSAASGPPASRRVSGGGAGRRVGGYGALAAERTVNPRHGPRNPRNHNNPARCRRAGPGPPSARRRVPNSPPSAGGGTGGSMSPSPVEAPGPRRGRSARWFLSAVRRVNPPVSELVHTPNHET